MNTYLEAVVENTKPSWLEEFDSPEDAEAREEMFYSLRNAVIASREPGWSLVRKIHAKAINCVVIYSRDYAPWRRQGKGEKW